MIERILLPGVIARESFCEVSAPVLFADERPAVSLAVDARRREFVTARECARDALETLGVGRVAIPKRRDGAPQWPEDVVGSITHCEGYRAAAVARRASFAAIGIDAEPAEDVPRGVLEQIASAQEASHLHELGRVFRSTPWARLLFSAKESLFKAFFPRVHRPLGFRDAAVSFEPGKRVFSARVLVRGDRRLRGFSHVVTGRWLAQDGLLVTTVVLP